MGVTMTKPFQFGKSGETLFFLAYCKDDMMHQAEGNYKQHYLDEVVRILETKKSKDSETIHLM